MAKPSVIFRWDCRACGRFGYVTVPGRTRGATLLMAMVGANSATTPGCEGPLRITAPFDAPKDTSERKPH
mgnify:CR=1 FL=1